MRLHSILVGAIEHNGGRVFEGMQVIAAQSGSGKIVSVSSEAGVRNREHFARDYILASGGIMGGGFKTFYDGSSVETVFNLPTTIPEQRSEWLEREFLAPAGHAIFKAGVQVDQDFRPVSPHGGVIYDNLMIVGSAMAHCDCLRERSLEGVALATGFSASNRLGKSV
jgi:glycerol-3-phosphate dehydrogenase subunit B